MPHNPPDPGLLASVRISYQPIVRLADGTLDHVEVLARTAAADGTLHGPESILSAMTSSTRAVILTETIIERTLDEYGEFGFAAHNLKLAFNLKLDAMLHPGLMQLIDNLRARCGLSPDMVRFELTEDQPVHNLAAARAVITDLRDAGYGLALDDITPDMPYLAALLEMPIRAIKLDRSVVTSLSPAARNFIRDVAAQASTRQQAVIAEGIETTAQQETMRASQVTHGQGYLFSRPLSASALRSYLNAR
jgi:EAL domain-containing protein (putative c-di-GMP-specific phosphodiesterase class I)